MDRLLEDTEKIQINFKRNIKIIMKTQKKEMTLSIQRRIIVIKR